MEPEVVKMEPGLLPRSRCHVDSCLGADTPKQAPGPGTSLTSPGYTFTTPGWFVRTGSSLKSPGSSVTNTGSVTSISLYCTIKKENFSWFVWPARPPGKTRLHYLGR